MSDGEGGKKVGIFGGLIAALGMLLARGADDCARIGAVTAKGAAPLADDAARISARGAAPLAGAADDGLLAAGRGAGLADEAAHSMGNSSRLAAGAGAGDDALGAAARSGDDWLDNSLDVAGELVSSVDFDVGGDIESDSDDVAPPLDPAGRGSGSDRGATKGGSSGGEAIANARPAGVELALKRSFIADPKAIAAFPATSAAYERMFGVAPQSGELPKLSVLLTLAGQPSTDLGMKQLAAMLAERRASNPVTILGYTDGLNIKIALPSGERVTDAELHEACMSVGMNCLVLACDEKVPADGEPCAESIYNTWSIRARQAKLGKPAMTLGRFARSLLIAPSMHEGSPMVLSRVARAPDGKLKLLRARPKGSSSAP